VRERKWKDFDGVARRANGDVLRVSINPGGEVMFDVATYREMGEPRTVKLMYEESTKTIGIKPVSADLPAAVVVRKRYARSTRVIRSRPFFKACGIDISRSLRLPSAYIEDKVLVLDLQTAVSLGHGWKKVDKEKERQELAAQIRAEREKVKQERIKIQQEIRAERESLRQQKLQALQVERKLNERQREIERAQREWQARRGPFDAR
jgi:hypothetical protein